MPSGRRYSREVRDEAVAKVLKGASIDELAAQLEVNRSTLRGWVHKARIGRRVVREPRPQHRPAPSPSMTEPTWRPVSHTGPGPSHQQIGDRLRAAILNGALRPGQQLPSHLHMAGLFGVAQVCVKRALSDLAHHGFVVTRQGVGTFVAGDGKAAGDSSPIQFEVTRDTSGRITLTLSEGCALADVRELSLQLVVTLSENSTGPTKIVGRRFAQQAGPHATGESP